MGVKGIHAKEKYEWVSSFVLGGVQSSRQEKVAGEVLGVVLGPSGQERPSNSPASVVTVTDPSGPHVTAGHLSMNGLPNLPSSVAKSQAQLHNLNILTECNSNFCTVNKLASTS